MNKKTVISSLLLAGALGATSTAFAFTKDQFQGEFFETRIQTTVKKDHSIDYTGSAPYALNDTKIKADSGKKTCYSVLDWLGDATDPGYVDQNEYVLVTVCEVAGAWEYDDDSWLDVLTNGSLGTDWESLYTPLNGTSFYTGDETYAGYEGTLVLKTSFKKDGSTKNIKLVAPQDGMVYYGDQLTDHYGTAKSGFSLKRVALDKVPTAAVSCINGVVDLTDTTNDPKCPVSYWNQP